MMKSMEHSGPEEGGVKPEMTSDKVCDGIPPFVEKRRFPRFRERLAFALTAHPACVPPSEIGSAIVFNTTDDISVGGLRFQHKSLFEVGTLLRVVLTIPETLETLCRTAVVCSCRQLDPGGRFSTGLQFLTGADSVDPWSEYLQSRARA
jgi:hypothetical protein